MRTLTQEENTDILHYPKQIGMSCIEIEHVLSSSHSDYKVGNQMASMYTGNICLRRQVEVVDVCRSGL